MPQDKEVPRIKGVMDFHRELIISKISVQSFMYRKTLRKLIFVWLVKTIGQRFLMLKNYFFLFLFFPLLSWTQLSTIHYIPPLTTSDQGNADPVDQYLYISTPNFLPCLNLYFQQGIDYFQNSG